ncbi:hypothetical protein ABQF17_22225 [Mycolicibacterium elephantis]
MRDLDALIADIDALEADDELRPLPGESVEAFKRRMLAEFDALSAEEDSGGEYTIAPSDAWAWRPEFEPEPEPVPAAPPAYLLEEWEIGSLMPKGGPLSAWIGGRCLGTLNPTAA